MNYDDASEIYRSIQGSRWSDGPPRALTSWLEAAITYASVRSGWQLLSSQERAERDLQRTSLHNVAIDAINRLSREMGRHGESIEWRARLGDDRRRIGDFACWCALFMGLSAR